MEFSQLMIPIASIIRKLSSDIFQEAKTIENINKEKALERVRDEYKGFDVKVEKMPGGLGYYVKYKNIRHLVATYDLGKNKLWYRIPKQYVFKKL